MFNRVEIGKRIRQARDAKGLRNASALAEALQKKYLEKCKVEGIKPRGRALARQTVENWEKGAHVPPWEKVELMAAVFGPEHNEEWIMFGARRALQIQEEKTILARISPEESRLIQTFRAANDQGQSAILASAKGISGQHPAPDATLLSLNSLS